MDNFKAYWLNLRAFEHKFELDHEKLMSSFEEVQHHADRLRIKTQRSENLREIKPFNASLAGESSLWSQSTAGSYETQYANQTGSQRLLQQDLEAIKLQLNELAAGLQQRQEATFVRNAPQPILQSSTAVPYANYSTVGGQNMVMQPTLTTAGPSQMVQMVPVEPSLTANQAPDPHIMQRKDLNVQWAPSVQTQPSNSFNNQTTGQILTSSPHQLQHISENPIPKPSTIMAPKPKFNIGPNFEQAESDAGLQGILSGLNQQLQRSDSSSSSEFSVPEPTNSKKVVVQPKPSSEPSKSAAPQKGQTNTINTKQPSKQITATSSSSDSDSYLEKAMKPAPAQKSTTKQLVGSKKVVQTTPKQKLEETKKPTPSTKSANQDKEKSKKDTSYESMLNNINDDSSESSESDQEPNKSSQKPSTPPKAQPTPEPMKPEPVERKPIPIKTNQATKIIAKPVTIKASPAKPAAAATPSAAAAQKPKDSGDDLLSKLFPTRYSTAAPPKATNEPKPSSSSSTFGKIPRRKDEDSDSSDFFG